MWRKLQSNLHLRPPHENGHLSRRIVHTLTLIKTSLQWQWPLECIPNCQNNLSATANFFQQLMKKSRMVMLCFLNKIVILHPYLPMTATSLQRPLSSEPKAAIVEMFDCTSRSLICNLNPSPEFLICCTILKRFYSGKPLIFLTRWGIFKGWWLCWRPVTSPTMVAILAFIKNKKSG